jgi:paraquat-inducible protein A
MSPPSDLLPCRLCGYEHRPIPLGPGERALCVRCHAVLARGSRFGADAPLAFAITGLILALPATLLPFVTAGKFGSVRVGLLFTGVEGLWDHGMRWLSIWVFLCGGFGPILLLGVLIALLLPARLGRPELDSDVLRQTAHALAHWAMPEVHVLAVLVALVKLGSLVNVTIGPGFWCYAAMSFMLLLAWRSFDLGTFARTSHAAVSVPS